MPDNPNPPSSGEILRAIEREMTDIATDLLAEAKRQTPREKSTLVRSGRKDVRRIGDRIEARISFNTPYAARQHEELSYRHPRGGNAKYLERPLRAMVPEFERRLAAAMRRAIS